MTDEPNLSPLDSALEARVVALVLGEASDFERDELLRLIDEREDVAAFYEQTRRMHALMEVVGEGESEIPGPEWRLPNGSRERLLAIFEGDESPVFEPIEFDATSGHRASSKRWLAVAVGIAASVMLIGFGGSFALLQLVGARSDVSSAARIDSAGEAEGYELAEKAAAIDSIVEFPAGRGEVAESIADNSVSSLQAIEESLRVSDFASNAPSASNVQSFGVDADSPMFEHEMKTDVGRSVAPLPKTPERTGRVMLGGAVNSESDFMASSEPSSSRQPEGEVSLEFSMQAGDTITEDQPFSENLSNRPLAAGRASRDTLSRNQGVGGMGMGMDADMDMSMGYDSNDAMNLYDKRTQPRFDEMMDGGISPGYPISPPSGQSNAAPSEQYYRSGVARNESDVRESNLWGLKRGFQQNNATLGDVSGPTSDLSLSANGKREADKAGEASSEALSRQRLSERQLGEISDRDSIATNGQAWVELAVPEVPSDSTEDIAQSAPKPESGPAFDDTASSFSAGTKLRYASPTQPMLGKEPSLLMVQPKILIESEEEPAVVGRFGRQAGQASESSEDSPNAAALGLIPDQLADQVPAQSSNQALAQNRLPTDRYYFYLDAEGRSRGRTDQKDQVDESRIKLEALSETLNGATVVEQQRLLRRQVKKLPEGAADVARGIQLDDRVAGIPARKPVAEGLNETDANESPFSTFSLHVSDVSFKLARAALSKDTWPESSKIRIEEFVNAFDYGDPLPRRSERVACRIEQAAHPALQQRNLMRIALRTASTGRTDTTPLRLTLLLDNSGSMERHDRSETLRRAFKLLADQMNAQDQITLISFARQPRLIADKVAGGQTNELLTLLDQLPAQGGTNLEAAIGLAFEKAQEHFDERAQNRIVLLTDGAVNLGDADPQRLSDLVGSMRAQGIAFDAAGICADGLNDEILESLTLKGDGRYYLLDSAETADESFARQIAGALRPSAKNVKVQVEFNPARVGRYKLLGFEKHRLNKEDFRNDQVDAAELAAAEAGVAIYQFEAKPDGEGDIGVVSVRFLDLNSGRMIENHWPIPYQNNALRLESATPSLKVAATAALFAAKLKGDPIGDTTDYDQLTGLLSELPTQLMERNRVRQLIDMVRRASQISGTR
ncbi:vWA domain-containing protein [Roseiconus lacunae]|uniref:vWA domain-containing protein n=1 Tax=Roseiconus lacunae TaxID=2605694 RepID=UPI001E60E8C0|nr:von Willebrand factor type A domain-containing protein [Roseiconus lacunae]MCD0462879.1 von Willebrand factor type A domain-containing protein [Roseiconus lacunae]